MNPHTEDVLRFAFTTIGAGLALAGAITCCTPSQQAKAKDARAAASAACADLAKWGPLLDVILPAAAHGDAGVDAAGE